MQKHRDHTEFACFVRNYTARPVCLTVPFGEMERRGKLSAAELASLLERNRQRYGADGAELTQPADRHITSATGGPGLGTPDLL